MERYMYEGMDGRVDEDEKERGELVVKKLKT